MVILDSDHSTNHVFKEMELYSNLVSQEQYMIVEDGLIEYVYPIFCRRGPLKAINKFIRINTDFIIDEYRTRFLLTQNPSGYLLKTKNKVEVRTESHQNLQPLRLSLPYNPFSKDTRWLKYLGQNTKQKN